MVSHMIKMNKIEPPYLFVDSIQYFENSNTPKDN